MALLWYQIVLIFFPAALRLGLNAENMFERQATDARDDDEVKWKAQRDVFRVNLHQLQRFTA